MYKYRSGGQTSSLSTFWFISANTASIIAALGVTSTVIRLSIAAAWLLVSIACVVAHGRITRG